MSENRNVPRLRFFGFSDGWKKATLSDVSTNVGYGMNSAATEFDGIHKYIRITDIDEGSRVFKPSPLSSPDGIIDPKYKLQTGDLLFARTGASVGKSYLYKESDGELYFAGFLIRFSIKRENPFFIYQQTISERFRKWIGVMSMRSGQPGINAEEYKSFTLSIPSLPEQQKIAEFLTAVDRRIELLQTKKEKLEAYKKGVMQKIFSQKLRFKADDGSDFPEWEERKLGEVAKFSKGKGISKSEISEAGTQECIRYGELYTEYAEVIDVVISRTELDQSGLVLSQANDVIIPSSGETQLDIARASCVLRSGIALGGDLNIIRSTLNGVFLSFYLNHRRKHQIAKMAQGISVVHLYNSQLQELEIEIPCLDEQKKIVQFLTSLDSGIENLNQQITHTQTWKKGLLQGMFV